MNLLLDMYIQDSVYVVRISFCVYILYDIFIFVLNVYGGVRYCDFLQFYSKGMCIRGWFADIACL